MHFWVKTATIILGLAIFGTACAEARVSAVGSHEFLMTDASRPDPVDGSHRRQWIVELFYPTTPQRVTTGYAADPVLLDALVAENYYDTPVGELRSWATRRAPAVRDARPLTPRPLPLILLSPGSGFARLSYSELAARLVARDYVVAIIDHPYIGISHLPDGRMLDANNDPAQASEDPHALTPRVIEWSDDVSRVIDHLQAEAGRSIAPGLKIDFKRMAAAGHSVGGSVALDVCAHDVRIMACADFEGDLFGSRAETQGVRRPVLVTGSRAKGRPPIASATGQDVRTRMLTLLGQAGESSVWYVKVTGGSHTSFSDAPWVMPQTLSRFGGELMTPERSADLYTGMLDAFIRAYQAGGGGDAAFQAFLGTATETQGGTLDARLSAQPISEGELWRSYQQRDFFFLRDHIPRATENETNRVRFLRAATQVAFGEHAAAKQTLQQILAKMPDSEIEESTRRLLMREERSSYHYRQRCASLSIA